MKTIINIRNIKLYIAIIFLIILQCYPIHKIAAETEVANEVVLDYFYYNPCGSCDVEKEFHETLLKLLGDEKTGINLKINYFNVFTVKGEASSKTYIDKHNISREDQGFPIAFIGDKYLIGEEAIYNNLKNDIINEHNKKTLEEIKGKTSIIYFYANGCKDCETAKIYLDTLPDLYSVRYGNTYVESEVSIVYLDMGNMDNLEMLRKYTIEHNVPYEQQIVPIIFIGEEYLSGVNEIKGKLETFIKEGQGLVFSNIVTEDEEMPNINLSGYTLIGVTVTGLVNGLNPCSISMLLFLISMLLTKKMNILKLGFAFIFGKFITYILLGTLFYNILIELNINWINSLTKWFLLAIFLILFLLNLSDFFASKHEKYNKIRLQLPPLLRKLNHLLIRKVNKIQNINSLIAFCVILGVLISVGEFLCTGQIYLATIIYVLKNTGTFNMTSIFYFVLYGVAFVIPLVIITIVIHKSKEYFSMSEAIRDKMHLIKFVNMTLFLMFFIVVFFWF